MTDADDVGERIFLVHGAEGQADYGPLGQRQGVFRFENAVFVDGFNSQSHGFRLPKEETCNAAVNVQDLRKFGKLDSD
jgi:hypothetical protein